MCMNDDYDELFVGETDIGCTERGQDEEASSPRATKAKGDHCHCWRWKSSQGPAWRGPTGRQQEQVLILKDYC